MGRPKRGKYCAPLQPFPCAPSCPPSSPLEQTVANAAPRSSPTVLSFMSQWGGLPNTLHKNPPSAGPSPGSTSPAAPPSPAMRQQGASPNLTHSATALESYNNERPPSRTAGRERSDSRASVRPMSMIQTYQPPVMEVSQDTLPELQRIFMFLNSHSNKLYQEGYFLKFHDTDSRTSINHVTHTWPVILTACRRPSPSRPKVARVLCPTCGHHSFAVGCECARSSRRRG